MNSFQSRLAQKDEYELDRQGETMDNCQNRLLLKDVN